MRRRGNSTTRVLVFAVLLVLVGLNTPGLLSQSQIESPEAPRVTYVLLPKTRCVVAPPGLPAGNCPSGTLPPSETFINWIAADGSDFEGAIGYKDVNKDIIKVAFRVVEATEVKDAPPGTFRAGQVFSFEPPAQTSETGEFGFRIFTTVPQDVTLEVTLEDAKKNISQPKIFSFKAVGPEPIISGITFPGEIPLGAEQKVLVGFIDREGQLSRVYFQLVNFDPKRVGDCSLPTDPNGIDVSDKVLGDKEGELGFAISCNSAQRIKLKVTLLDRQGYSSDSDQITVRQRKEFEFITGKKVADGLFFLDQFGQDGSELGAFRRPQGIAVDSKGNIYVADTENHRIQRFDPATFKLNEKLPTAVWGSRCLLRTGEGCRDPDGGGPLVPGDGQFDGPTDVVVDPTGNVYVVDSGNHRIQKFDANGKFLAKWGTRGSGPGQFETPISIALDSTGKFAYVADKGNHRIQKFDVSRSPVQFVTQWGSECNLTVTPPTGRCVDPDGAGPRQIGDGQFFEPQAIAVDKAGNVYVSDTGNHRIQKFKENGEFLLKWGRNGFASGQFDVPRGLALTDQGILLVVDQNNHRVQEFKLEDGSFKRQWGVQGNGEGEFIAPQDIAVDSAGNIYIVELLTNRVQKLGDLK